MEIQVGEYVRTDEGIIDKVIKIEEAGSGTRFFGERLEDTIIITNRDILSERRIDATDIVKHSKNIIDLIEEGDYVNGEKIDKILQVSHKHNSIIINNEEELLEQDIKLIATHQQFKQVEYEV